MWGNDPYLALNKQKFALMSKAPIINRRQPGEYLYSLARDYAGEKGLVNIELV